MEACWKVLPFCHKNTLLSVSCSTAAASVQARGAQECREHPSHVLLGQSWHRGQYSSSNTSPAAVSVKEAACNFPCVLQLLYSSCMGCALLWRMQERARNRESKEREANKEMYVGVLDEKNRFWRKERAFLFHQI